MQFVLPWESPEVADIVRAFRCTVVACERITVVAAPPGQLGLRKVTEEHLRSNLDFWEIEQMDRVGDWVVGGQAFGMQIVYVLRHNPSDCWWLVLFGPDGIFETECVDKYGVKLEGG